MRFFLPVFNFKLFHARYVIHRRRNFASRDGNLSLIFTTLTKTIYFARSDIRVEQCSTPSDILSAKFALIQLLGYFDGEI